MYNVLGLVQIFMALNHMLTCTDAYRGPDQVHAAIYLTARDVMMHTAAEQNVA